MSETGFSTWFMKRRGSMAAKHILDHATKVLDTAIDLDKAISWLQESRNENALASIKALYLDEKAASSIEVTLFEDLSKGELEPKQREALMRLVLRIDDISQNTKQAGLNLELIAQSKKQVPKEFWNMYKDLSKRFVAQTGALRSAIEAFGQSDDDVLKRREEVKNIEQQIDDAYFYLRKKLILSSSGPLALLVLMDVLTWVESASDRAKDAADMLYILVMANR